MAKRYKREYQQPIKLKVINVIKHWLERYYNDDFSNDASLLSSLNEFIEKIGQENKSYQNVLTKTLKKVTNQSNQTLKIKQSNIVDNEDDTDDLTSSRCDTVSQESKSSSSRSSSTSTADDVFQLIDHKSQVSQI